MAKEACSSARLTCDPIARSIAGRWASLLLLSRLPPYLKRWPSIHTWKQEGSGIDRGIWRRNFGLQLSGRASNQVDLESAICLGLCRRNQHSAFQGKPCASPRGQKRARRALAPRPKHHAASKFPIIPLPFRGPIAGLSRLEKKAELEN